MKNIFHIKHKRALSFLLVFVQTALILISLTSCGHSLVEQAAEEENREKEAAVSINDLVEITKGKVKTKDKKAIDYSTERFQTDGINAFYILPGLENIPDAMASFEVLDYNSKGDFVYYYVTPCYITPEELSKYNTAPENTGIVRDRSAVNEPEGRKEDYLYDAVVLMSYNPDTGAYRVIYAKAYTINKETEFDPETEGRPYYYEVPSDAEDNLYKSYISERAFGCKVAGREEYLFMDQDGLNGRVYDVNGSVISTMTYQSTLENEIKNKKNELMDLRNQNPENEGIDEKELELLEKSEENNGKKTKSNTGSGDKDQMNFIVTGIAMTESYESYVGVTFFLGNDLFDPGTVQQSTTYMIYRQSLDEEEGGARPFISVNNHSDRQMEEWMSLDKKFFTSREEYENATGYDMLKMKTGEEGDEYKDEFTPFIAGSGTGDASVLVELPDFREMPGKWFDKTYCEKLVDSYNWIITNEITFLTYYARLYKGELNRSHFTEDDDAMAMYVNNYLSEMGKKCLQNIVANGLMRFVGNGSSLYDVIEKLAGKGWIPVPGEYKEEDGTWINKRPMGFVDGKETSTPALGFVSDHTLSVVSNNGVYNTYIAPVDYYADSEKSGLNKVLGFKGVMMEPYAMSDRKLRTVYVYDIPAADEQKEEIINVSGLSDSAKDAIEEITVLLRTSEETLKKIKLGWFINEIVNHDLDDVMDDLLDEAEDAYDDDEISEKEYDEIMDLYDRIEEDLEERETEDILDKIREDAEEKHDKGEISNKEFKEIEKILDKAENEELGLDDDALEALERLMRGSSLIADVQGALVSSNNIERDEILERVNELSKEIPEDIREGMLYLCAGFSINIDELASYPLSYKVVFPEGAAVSVRESGQSRTVGGSMDSFRDGVLVASECQGDIYKGNSFVTGYKGVGAMDLFFPYSYGKPMDVTSIGYYDGKTVRTIVVLRTDKGVRFFEKGDKIIEGKNFSMKELEDMIGKDNAQIVSEAYDVDTNIQSLTLEGVEAPPKVGISAGDKEMPAMAGVSIPAEDETDAAPEREKGFVNKYTALSLGGRGKEAYKEASKEGGVKSPVKESDFEGFMTYKMLLTSSGYTREAENRRTGAIEEGLALISASENAADNNDPIEKSTDRSLLSEDEYLAGIDESQYMNERFTGHLSSARNISMISKDKALICSMDSGTKILDLNHGTVADDKEGSYYRAFQVGNTTTFKLLGFEENGNSYLDNDIPMSKVYTLEYGSEELDRSVIDSFKKMLKQYAEDFLYREYRTEFSENEEFVVKEKTEEEKQESIDAGKIFDPEITSYEQALTDLEKKYSINNAPDEIREYAGYLRERIAGVKPGIAKIYQLAGAKKLSGDNARRSEGYFKNLESRITMAMEKDALYDILVEIRMHEEVLPELDREQADKYRSYKEVLDYTKEQYTVSAGDIFREGEAERTPEEVENDRLRNSYRQDVINDIIDEYAESLKKPGLSEEEATEPDSREKKEIFDNYLQTLLNQVNPDNLTMDEEKTTDEFLDIINHGKETLTGVRFEEMTERLKKELPSIDAVWKLEEMIIKEKVEHESAYSAYKDWLKDYNDRVEEAENEANSLNVPVSGKSDDSTVDTPLTPLSGKDRITYLRTSKAYKAVIGDLKKDKVVKEFLSGKKETWDDYCKYVIKKSGAGAVKDDSGYVEGSGIGEALEEIKQEDTSP